MVAPASLVIAKDFDIRNSVEVQLTISVYILAYGESLLIKRYAVAGGVDIHLSQPWDH